MQPWEIFSIGAFCGTIFGMGLFAFLFMRLVPKQEKPSPVKLKKIEKEDTLIDTRPLSERISSVPADPKEEEPTGRFTRLTLTGE